MVIYTDSEAQQNFSQLLEQAVSEEVLIIRADGLSFAIMLKPLAKLSPFAITGIKTSVTTADILDALRESRQAENSCPSRE